ncbi:SDR family NAD(P)-dependent oxidoreductase [Dysosmobacter sp.]|uniref:SDR family NAD(P)-dependent oxidoreductase n=1 Tax=Dysosmobacter sp. TaxID=2591382 RepID=UPI002A8978B4|nr:SDR family NAD(P)-dependent oxidoreductase [Dysosmobacter sp.]MDY3281379.1 SDR family NAD(P)-dependent oxidoreductase [Dysosmobacter sp.]
MKFSYQDRVAIIVGCSNTKGFAYATAKMLGEQGAVLVAADINEEGARAVAEILRQDGYQAIALPVDVTDEASQENLMKTVYEKYGRIDVIMNVAGISQSIRTLEMTTKAWDRMIAINLTGTFLTMKTAIPYMQKNGYGRIVNLASVSAKNGGGVFGGPHYIAAKSGVIGLTRALGKEFVRDGITVNCVAPGPCNTGLLDTDFTPMAAGIPAGRIAVPDDVAAAMVFLASEEAGYITGVTVNVNGGAYMG